MNVSHLYTQKEVVGVPNSLCTRIVRATTNHAPIQECSAQFSPPLSPHESTACPCDQALSEGNHPFVSQTHGSIDAMYHHDSVFSVSLFPFALSAFLILGGDFGGCELRRANWIGGCIKEEGYVEEMTSYLITCHATNQSRVFGIQIFYSAVVFRCGRPCLRGTATEGINQPRERRVGELLQKDDRIGEPEVKIEMKLILNNCVYTWSNRREW